MGGENLTKPFRRVDLRKECALSHVGDIKGPARLSGELKQPIGCRQREHVVVKENGKARRGIHTNENIGQTPTKSNVVKICLTGM